MKRICGIYLIENLETHQKYVGQSIDIYSRWKEHMNSLNKNKHSNYLL